MQSMHLPKRCGTGLSGTDPGTSSPAIVLVAAAVFAHVISWCRVAPCSCDGRSSGVWLYIMTVLLTWYCHCLLFGASRAWALLRFSRRLWSGCQHQQTTAASRCVPLSLIRTTMHTRCAAAVLLLCLPLYRCCVTSTSLPSHSSSNAWPLGGCMSAAEPLTALKIQSSTPAVLNRTLSPLLPLPPLPLPPPGAAAAGCGGPVPSDRR